MKISRPKLLSVVCFGITLAVALSLYLKIYNNDNKYVYIQRVTTTNESLATEKDDNEEEVNNVEEVEGNITEEITATVEPEKVYDDKTLDELAEQLNKSLSSTLENKGYLYASYSLEKGVDPYLAVAISLEETGCSWGCSDLVVTCNNVGGMKGSGCGSYAAFNTIDDGIKAFIDNIYNNYVAYGLTTAETMNPKYAENPMWSSNVNAYIERIKNK